MLPWFVLIMGIGFLTWSLWEPLALIPMAACAIYLYWDARKH